MYGLKQAPQTWYIMSIEHISKLNFKKLNLDGATMSTKKVTKTKIFLVVYVHDIWMVGNKNTIIHP